ncbi:hypothetical protein [Oceanithermus desulfurans]|uniref:Antitoxin SocA-like Panacea domain-containing protein n=2 Tax=Oceanithermus desulfurans TaxID=227924 RepID=A0A511RP23_9DEIN|nr:hypothetical protein [Oceanithermus desulfurans]MBB6030879.1 uncharacterized protein YwgA [Oceanithermus desulfurans]GEM90827.1 hypothetical protein ODE01S_22610 [Oceanithermus desulfurans NBRC 100063]
MIKPVISPKKVVSIIEKAGGRVVGKTRLQKMVYIMEAAGIDMGYDYVYFHYGPYSEDLSNHIEIATAMGIVKHTESLTADGKRKYSIYEIVKKTLDDATEADEQNLLLKKMNETDSITLELAATALYLKKEEGYEDPWEETSRRKPRKATPERLEKAKKFYSELKDINSRLPEL